MLNELKPVKGARKNRKRVGRGPGSGTGSTSGRGDKGQLARSGGRPRPGFEGGQLPFFQRIPKRGFKNYTRKEYAIVNLSELEKFNDGDVVTPDVLLASHAIKKLKSGLKVLGNGELTKKLTVKANVFSKTAEAAITKAGGTIEVI